jgi:hypothetical protein
MKHLAKLGMARKTIGRNARWSHLQANAMVAIEKIATPWFEQIDANRTQSRTHATLRDTLLPKLLSGELRVAKAVISPATE